MKTVFKNVWKPSRGVVIRDLDRNLFAFQFFTPAGRDYFLNKGPWAFDGNILLLRTITRYDCDESNLFCAGYKSINFHQVDIDVTKPLRRGMKVMMRGKPIWISFRYVKLPEFCYGCSRLGHTLSICDEAKEVDEDSDLPYGDSLRGSLIKPTRRYAEAQKQEEKRLFLTYQHDSSSNKPKKKLHFEAPHDSQPPSSNFSLGKGTTASDNMTVDDTLPLQPGNKAFNRKLIDRGLNVSLLTMSLHHVDVIIRDFGGSQEWRFTGLYGYPDSQHKTKTCDLISDLHGRSDLPWLLGGDINEIFYNLEKKGGPEKPQAILDHFRDTFSACNLHDLGYVGYEFTWWNKRDGGQSVEERLDHFMASLEWSLLLPEAKAFHINAKLSDHLHIQLKLKGGCQETSRSSTQKSFKFKNMWALYEGCGEVIKRAWNHSGTLSLALDSIKRCASDLSAWNFTEFGHVQHKIHDLELSLKGTYDIQQRDDILSKISLLRWQEVILWLQRCRIDFLRHGHSNSRWFHARALARPVMNHILCLVDEVGIEKMSLDDIADIVTNDHAGLLVMDIVSQFGMTYGYLVLSPSDQSNGQMMDPPH
ncbi:LOW QUALITY PROTEIN: hypothetical protein Cgig2_022475 [Carnegiea gigantea]|uniref:Zinc knuckle CX2CX4HX4C domain-containing protein n=1 Tax=Carnegiea gigantea TaxID=171969 RepID=A0A9Q1KAJ5_9CARY|nr:LOW QUALITY PROTEIN: hypothetical protein Cgig2_022475 [Carnegiea gigantea]